jgi:hypothetical protein
MPRQINCTKLQKNFNTNIRAPKSNTSIYILLLFSIGTTAHCGLWPVEHYPSIFSYLSPTLSIFSLLALEDLFLLPLSIISWVFPYVSPLPILE